MPSKRAVITGWGSYLPSEIIDNEALSRMVDTDDAWIRERTGITQRHRIAAGELTSDMAAHAGKAAISRAKISAQDVDLILVATTTPDRTFPATACFVQAKLGCRAGAAAFDVQAVCSGFIYALSLADSLIRSGMYRTILVIGADSLSRIVDWSDRGTCILFGDGAGALVLQAQETDQRGILATTLHADGNYASILQVDGGTGLNQTAGVIHMEGKEVFKHAVKFMAETVHHVLDMAGKTAQDLTWVVPHQANQRIMTALMDRLNLPQDRLISTVAQHANTSAASIPLALATAADAGKLQKGDVIASPAVGGGLTWGAALFTW